MGRKSGARHSRAGQYMLALFAIMIAILLLSVSGIFRQISSSPQYIPAKHAVCSIDRPGGAGTIANISLVGNCTDDVWFRSAVSLNSKDVGIATIDNSVLGKTGSFTVTEWTYIRPQSGNVNILAALLNETTYSYASSGIIGYDIASGSAPYNLSVEYLPVYRSSVAVGWNAGNGISYIDSNNCNMTNAEFIALEYNESGNSLTLWKNGIECGTGVELYGVRNLSSGLSLYANYELANVQLYNASLSAMEIRELYLRGIYGTPSPIKNVMGWWPLDGGGEDHSGNNYSLALYNITYNGISVFRRGG